jgi:hypothetical protein
MSEGIGRQPQYDVFADEFLEHARDGFFNWLRHGGSYFGVRVIEETWRRGWQVRHWLAPLERTCEEIAEAGFLIERLTEPRPLPEAAVVDPDRHELFVREPQGFVAFRLRPWGGQWTTTGTDP